MTCGADDGGKGCGMGMLNEACEELTCEDGVCDGDLDVDRRGRAMTRDGVDRCPRASPVDQLRGG